METKLVEINLIKKKRNKMSIVIDDDDDLICTTDNAIETVYADDQQFTDFVAAELAPHEGIWCLKINNFEVLNQINFKL